MDNNDFFKIEHNKITPQQGMILISEPFANDFYFKRSVVLLTDHSPQGSMGFILNNFSIEIPISSILNELPKAVGKLAIGGPVSTDSLFYLHTFGKEIEGSIPIQSGLFWGGDFDEIKVKLNSNQQNIQNIRFFLGYAGWSPGQLENEINNNYWLVSNTNIDNIMNVQKDFNLWKAELKRLGKKYEIWSKFPENPQLN